jgi:hypothetical protein
MPREPVIRSTLLLLLHAFPSHTLSASVFVSEAHSRFSGIRYPTDTLEISLRPSLPLSLTLPTVIRFTACDLGLATQNSPLTTEFLAVLFSLRFLTSIPWEPASCCNCSASFSLCPLQTVT